MDSAVIEGIAGRRDITATTPEPHVNEPALGASIDAPEGRPDYVDFVEAVLRAASTVDGRFREFAVAHALHLAPFEDYGYHWLEDIHGPDAKEAFEYAIRDLVALGLASEFPSQPPSYALTNHGVQAVDAGLRHYLRPYVPMVCTIVPRPARLFLDQLVTLARAAEQPDPRYVLPSAFEAHSVYAAMGEPFDLKLARLVVINLVRAGLVGQVGRNEAGDRLIVWPFSMGYLCAEAANLH